MAANGAYEPPYPPQTGAPQQPSFPLTGTGVPFSVAQHISNVEAEYRRQQQQQQQQQGPGNAGPAGGHAAYYLQAAYAQHQQQQQQPSQPQQQQVPGHQHAQQPSGDSAPQAPPAAEQGQDAPEPLGSSSAGSEVASAETSAEDESEVSDAENPDAEPPGSISPVAGDDTDALEMSNKSGTGDKDAVASQEDGGSAEHRDQPTVGATGEDISAA